MTLLQLVDETGTTIGHAEKLVAHEDGGLLHRAVSVVLINERLEILVQRRAAAKYHFAGKWANAGCTHPLADESPVEAGQRALRHELGVETHLVEVLRFVYEAHDEVSGYTEREYDHVLFGSWSGAVTANPNEVSEVLWVSAEELAAWLKRDSAAFAQWFHGILRELDAHFGEGRIRVPGLMSFVSALRSASQASRRP